MPDLNRKLFLGASLYIALILSFALEELHATPTEAQKKAQEQGKATAAEAKALVGLNKEVAQSSEQTVKALAAARGINEAVFTDKNPNETIDMITYQIKGGHIVETKDSIQVQKIRDAYDAAYKEALDDKKALVDKTFERDRASTEADRLSNEKEAKRDLAATLDEAQRKKAKGALLDQIGEAKKDYIKVQEQAQLAADRFAEAEAALGKAQEKADASKARFDQAATFYIQGNLEINKAEMAAAKAAEDQVAAESAPAATPAPENAPAAAAAPATE